MKWLTGTAKPTCSPGSSSKPVDFVLFFSGRNCVLLIAHGSETKLIGIHTFYLCLRVCFSVFLSIFLSFSVCLALSLTEFHAFLQDWTCTLQARNSEHNWMICDCTFHQLPDSSFSKVVLYHTSYLTANCLRLFCIISVYLFISSSVL